MSLDAVLARSRKRTRMTERRRFTVASDKAFDKQKQFAMQNPKDWVLRAFQAAVFSRAELVGMDTRPTQVTIGWIGGVGVLPEELDDLFHYLMTDRSDPTTRHLSQLALAVVGVLASDPVEVRIESIGIGQPVCMIIDSAGEARVGEPGRGIDGTYISVQKYRSLFRPFHGVSEAPETGRLWNRSQFSPVPLLVNPCSAFEYSRFGYVEQSADLVGRRDDRRWTLWSNGRRHQAEDELTIVVGGILVEHIKVPGLGMEGVVTDDGLRLSADQSKVSRGPRWAELLHFLWARIERWLSDNGRTPGHVQLPSLATPEEEEAGVVVEAPTEPVPDLIPTVAPRPALHKASAMGSWLYVLPDDAEDMVEALDPLDFPLQVAVLTEPQAETLRRGGRPVHRLTAGAGVAFVRRMAVADEVLAERTVEEGGLRLTLRLHPGHGAPPWGSPVAPLPLLVRRGGKTVHCGGAGLDLPGCSAVVEEAKSVEQAHDVVARLGLQAAEELTAHDSPEGRRLLLHLVGHLGLPHLAERDGKVVLELVLPPAIAHARSVPLLGERTLDDLLALAGTDETVAVERVEAFAALEGWLGVGHLTDGSVECGVLAAVGFDGSRWHPVKRLAQSGVSQVMAVLPTFRPAPMPRGRERHPLPLPLFAVYRDQRGDWAEGARALLALAHAKAQGSARLKALLPLVSVHLARLLGVGGGALHPKPGSHVEAVALGGLAPVSDAVLPVSLDLYRALLPDVRLPLHLDDEGDVWGAPDAQTWVVRLPVESALADGWVGLRRPFDPTGGVFLHQGDGHVELLADYSERTPAHGVLRTHGKVDASSYGLTLPGMQLYRSLAVWLDEHPDDEDALAYARHLVGTDVASPLVPELAPFVRLASGMTLADWLAMDPQRRPVLDPADGAFAFIPTAVSAAKWVERLQGALDVSCRARVRVRGLRSHGRFGATARYRGRKEDEVSIDVWLHAGDSVFDEVRAVEVLLLDAVRASALALAGVGFDVDVVAAVEVIAAGR